ncbi:MAG: hypothetical protein M3Q97_06510 [Bacteroidota bacterium]|nr:hypothetical protein [Bacteroidota bacterium]
MANDLLSGIVYDDRILKIVTDILGDKPVYFGDSSFLIDNKQWGFHKDNADRYDEKSPDWLTPYTILRCGIYLQDHTKQSGGLLLRDKSHKTTSINEGKAFNVPVEMGDLVIWSLKTTHSGNAKLFKLFPNIIVNPKYYNLIPDFLFREQDIPRVAIFLTYAKNDHHLQRYITYLKTREYAVSNWQKHDYSAETWLKVLEKPLTVWDMKKEAAGLDAAELNKEHADIPY